MSIAMRLFLVLTAVTLISPRLAGGQEIDKSHIGRRSLIDRYGAIIRGDISRKEIALVLTGDEFADGGELILRTCGKHHVKASFFLTGNFYSTPSFRQLIYDMRKGGHYLGAHSDKHLLYADWTRRDSLLVSREEFGRDLLANYEKMETFGIRREDARYFLPPYEWYNGDITKWTRELGFKLVNFTPGTRSAADYTYPEMGDRYVPSEKIYKSITDYEQQDRNGLNGFILLMHIGSDVRRKDKFYNKLDKLLDDLKRRGYTFVRIDELLGEQ